MARKKHDDSKRPAATEDPGELQPSERSSERVWQAALRPRTFDEYIGQRDLVENLRVSATG